MRQYRGKTKEGKWVYGSFVDFGTNRKYIVTSKAGYSYCRNGSRSYMHIKDCWEVIPSTVGQYTGLKDKNGVEIYEGDIVEGPTGIDDLGCYTEQYQIVYKQERCQYMAMFKDNVWTEFEDLFPLEVIGNIHQEVKI